MWCMTTRGILEGDVKICRKETEISIEKISEASERGMDRISY
jgi:uncharacterized membrane protein